MRRSAVIVLVALVAGGCAGGDDSGDVSAVPSTTIAATTTAPSISSAATTGTSTTLPAVGPGLILHNGVVITVDRDFDVAEAIAVSAGRIVAVGSDDDILALRGAGTVVVDLDGATVLPGIVDPHVHVIQHQVPDAEAMRAVAASLLETGRTTVGIPGISMSQLDAFEEVAGTLMVRVNLYLGYNTNCGAVVDPPPWEWGVDFTRGEEDQFAVAGVKVFADGGSCNGPAVGWEYPDPLPDFIGFADWVGNGSLYITAGELAEVVTTVGESGGQVVVHAAGERAVVTALDGMEMALGSDGNPLRHRLDHNDFVPPEQRARYGEIGVIPVVFADYDSCFENGGMWTFIAPAGSLRYHRANRSMIEANPGLSVAFHSDLPFTTFDIFRQLQFLVTVAEISDDGRYCPPPDFLAGEGVDVETAIRMMTWNSAYAMGLEEVVGSLEPGKIADLIVVESNPLTQPSTDLYQNAVWATLVGGEVAQCVVDDLCTALDG